MKKKGCLKLPRCGWGLQISIVFLAIAGNATADFGAYYTKINSGEAFEKVSRTGPHADIVVRDVGKENGRLVFWRGSSYLPYWEVNGQKFFLDELTERSGDGPAGRPDKVNTYSVVRIIENTPERVVIHWRYLPKFEGVNPHYNIANKGDRVVENLVDPSKFVDEYFVVFPAGKVVRGFRPGKEKVDAWADPENLTGQQLELTGSGIEELPEPESVDLNAIMGVSSVASNVVAGNPLKKKRIAQPIRCWQFNEGAGDVTLEETSGIECAVEGDKAYWKNGVSGTALAFDGYNSVIRLPTQSAPAITESVTLEGWVAIGAYPWNWTPVIQQGHEESYYLGVGPHGHVRMCVSIDGQAYRVDSTQQLERKQWVHVAGTYDKKSGLLRVFVNGELSGETNAVIGNLSVSREPIQIGQGKVMQPSNPVRASTYEDVFSFDGLIDEVRLYDVALSSEEIAKSYALSNPGPEICQKPDFDQRILPAGMKTGKFGAYYTHLKFYDTWDGLFRFGAHPDVVVEFDKYPTSFVFWRGTCFIPMIVNERGEWYSNEFNETWTRSGGEGCMEPMSDKESFSNHAKIIEKTPARTVIEWRYPLVDVKHIIANYDETTGWGDWGDWYYYIYPDGVASKVTHLWTDCSSGHEFQEGMVITGPDQHPESVIEVDPALELTTLDGEVRRYSWVDGPPKNVYYGGIRIHEIQYKGEYDPFTIAGGDRTSGGVYSGEVTDYSVFPSWNHWPVSQMPSDGRYAQFPDRTAHSSLTHFSGTEQELWNSDTPYKRQLFLEGMSKMGPEELLKLTKSWAQAPEIRAVSGCEAVGYDQAKRDYPLVATDQNMTVTVDASEEHPIVNICFSVKNWGHAGDAQIRMEGAESSDVRQGTFVDTDGTDTLVIWAELESVAPVEFTISGALPDKNYTALAAPAELSKPNTWAAWREMVRPKEPVAVREPVATWGEKMDGRGVKKVAVNTSIQSARSVTWSAWIKPESDGTVMSVMPGDGETWAPGAMMLELKGDELILDIGWLGVEKLKDAGDLKDGQWHHIAITMIPRSIHFYIDGQHRQDVSLMFKGSYPMGKATYMKVGTTEYKGIPHFSGGMGYVRLYDYAMTDRQVRSLYRDGQADPDADVVKNGAFELGETSPMFWEAGSSAFLISGKNGHGLQISGFGSSTVQTIALEKNREYILNVWVNTSDLLSGSVVIDMNNQFKERVVMDTVSSGWVQSSVHFNSGETTTALLRISPGEDFSGTVRIDDLSIEAVNAAPIITSMPGLIIEQDHPYIYSLVAEDPDSESVTYSAVKIPSWLHFYSRTGELTGTPGREDLGSHEVVLQVSSGEHTVEHRFAITVKEKDAAASKNLILNGSFEFGGDTAIFWDLSGALSVSTNRAQYGFRSLQISGPCELMKKTIALEKNTDYDISFWYNAVGLETGVIQPLFFEFK